MKKYSIEEIAKIYNVPVACIDLKGKSTFQRFEEMQLEIVEWLKSKILPNHQIKPTKESRAKQNSSR